MIRGEKQSLDKRKSIRTPAMWLLLLAVAAVVVESPQPGVAQGPLNIRSFSADQIHTMSGKTKTTKVHASPNAMRMEGEEKGKKSIVIMRFDRKVMWSLMPDQKMYVELPWASQAEWASWAEGAQVQRQPLGMEQVGAYSCEKSRVQVTLQGKVYTSLEWAAKELNGFVVKTQDEKGQWSNEYQNVQLGPQDPSLFEVPGDYKKLGLGGMFQNK
jgi:Domain of unknown function (DUF4412)